MLRLFTACLILIFSASCEGALQVKDEGVNKGYIATMDCVGAGISCSVSGVTGTLDVSAGGGAATPAGSDTQVQFNDTGNFAGDSGLTFNKTTNVLTATGGFTGTASSSTTMTVQGTTNEITSSAGAQDLSANRSWTLSLPSTIDLSSKTELKIPQSTAPTISALGDIGVDSDFYGAGRGTLMTFDGTSSTFIIGIQGVTACSDGQVPKASAGSGWVCGTDNNTSGFTVADTQVVFSDGANNPVGNSSLTFNKTTGALTATSVGTTQTNTPQVQCYPTQTSDTHWITGVNADGGNDNDDNWVLSEGTTLGTNNRISVAPGGVVTMTSPVLNTQVTTPKILSSTGTLTLGGSGGTNNELLSFNFESTADTISASSSTGVTDIDFGSLTLDAAAVNVSSSGGYFSILNSAASGGSGGGDLSMVSDDGAAMASGDQLGVMSFVGVTNGSGNEVAGSKIRSVTTGAWTGSSTPAKLELYTVPSGSTSNSIRMTIDSNGEVTVNSVSSDGTGKVVCVKSDGTLGTCSSVVASGGTCTCG